MKFVLYFTTAVLVGCAWSCTSEKKVDSEAIRQEINNREIVHITEAEIVQKAHELGTSIAVASQQALGKKLQGAINAKGVEYAIDYCNLNAVPLVDSLSMQYKATIRRVSKKNRNPGNVPSSMELQILEAYETQLADSVQPSTNVQPLGDDRYLFTKAIVIDNTLCLNCHGTPENGMLKTTKDFILTKYPDDKATGFSMGDLRGMWSIVLPKKNIVQTVSAE